MQDTEENMSAMDRFRPAFIYTGIRVKDMEKSLAFYTGILGMEIVERLQKTIPTKGEVVTLRSQASSQLLELNWYSKESSFYSDYGNGDELDHLAFEVDDIDKWITRLESLGIDIIVRIKEVEGWNEAFIKDPNGIWIEFLQRHR